MQKQIEDGHIINLIRQGDAEGMNLLYDKYADALYGVVHRIARSDELSEDILQDSLIKIWKSFHQYDAKKSRLFTWMMRICRNTALNYLESKAGRMKAKIQNIDKPVYTDVFLDQNINTDVLDLKGFVANMDGKLSEVVELLYFKGYTQKEASEALNIPLGTIKTRIKKAVSELRKLYLDNRQPLIWLLIIVTGQ